jgi:hypothetical protein
MYPSPVEVAHPREAKLPTSVPVLNPQAHIPKSSKVAATTNSKLSFGKDSLAILYARLSYLPPAECIEQEASHPSLERGVTATT